MSSFLNSQQFLPAYGFVLGIEASLTVFFDHWDCDCDCHCHRAVTWLYVAACSCTWLPGIGDCIPCYRQRHIRISWPEVNAMPQPLLFDCGEGYTARCSTWNLLRVIVLDVESPSPPQSHLQHESLSLPLQVPKCNSLLMMLYGNHLNAGGS